MAERKLIRDQFKDNAVLIVTVLVALFLSIGGVGRLIESEVRLRVLEEKFRTVNDELDNLRQNQADFQKAIHETIFGSDRKRR
jgi:hypothetical protein